MNVTMDGDALAATLDGSPLAEMPAELWARWTSDASFAPEGGESLAQLGQRVAAAMEELFAEPQSPARRAEGDLVIVSHVSPIKAAVAWALGTPDIYWRLHLRTASVTRIGWNRDAPVLHGFNEVLLAPAPAPGPQSPGA